MSTVTRVADRVGASWPVQHLRNHGVHLIVILALVAYPGVYHLLTGPNPLYALLESAFGFTLVPEAIALLPRMPTMIALLYFGLFAMSFDFISGYTGYLSFGHAAFYGTGAYFVILVANGKVPLLAPGTPFMLSLLLAGLLAALLALVIGLVSFRLTGVYFAMITLGFAQVMYVFIRGWDYVASNPRDGPTVGSTHPEGFEIGVPFVDQLSLAVGSFQGDEIDLLGHTLGTYTTSFYAVGLVVLVSYFAMQRIVHSPFGRVMVAIRDNEERVEAVGYNPLVYKLGAFVVSGFFGGVAGGLFAGYARSVTPESTFYFLTTGDALLASIIGGFGTLAGPLFGHLFDETLREFLSNRGQGGGLLPYLQERLGEGLLNAEIFGGLTVEGLITAALNGHAALYVGIVFVLFVLYVPNGILGTVRAWPGGPVAQRVPERLRELR